MAARRWWYPAAVIPILLACYACAGRESGPPSPLAELVRSYDREVTPYYPFLASDMGLREYDRVFANTIGAEYRAGMETICTRYRDALRRLDPARLTGRERVTYDVFTFRLETCVASFRFPSHLTPVDQVGHSWPSRFPIVGAGRGNHPFKTAQNYRDFLGRVDGFVVWMDTAIDNMRVGLARDITHPREAMLKLVPQLDAQIVDDPQASLFYEPVRRFPASFDDETRRALTARYLEAIQQKIVPAYRRLRAFVHDEYLPRCRTSSGLSAVPGGREWYAHAVHVSTTTGLTPAAIYEIGLAEVARIRAAMAALRAEIAAAGEPPPPRYRTLEDLLNGYAELRAAVDETLPRLFGRLPRAGFEIRPIEAFRERSMPSSYEAAAPDGSRPGVFYLNAGELRRRGSAPVYRNLYLHEAVPGHHFQIALQRENTDLPGFQRFGWYTAFGEGWALYAEALGVELGAYRSRWDRLGMLSGELFRARRLVVDVGLHDKGWTREQAVQYLGGRTPNNELEVDRYTVWPGQALGYKIGQLKFLELRQKAEAALGSAFDVRAFHDELLRDGALPLSVLEAKVNRWVARQKRA
ncbi:MAG TPA: DUF885 domain-containing protein [Methylomirabilota bacterium]|nr:DUF885 domain-containing protein [Methylomirabilota bacterium]